MATKQQVFNRVASHLLTQGRKAWENATCKYRAKDGCMCAFGCMIPDDRYTKLMEGIPVPNSPVWDGNQSLGLRELSKICAALGGDYLFYRELQCIHDSNYEGPDGVVPHWLKTLAATAAAYDLSPVVLEEFQAGTLDPSKYLLKEEDYAF